jgi:hypothetical protein
MEKKMEINIDGINNYRRNWKIIWNKLSK